MENYTETFGSKVQDIRLDGPDINTSILENIDNPIDWVKADRIEINFNKHDETLTIKDNGENGFGSLESLKRFFKLGEVNKDVTIKTIGKYGKGGYKSIINISKKIEIISYFNNNEYLIGTSFTEMIENNSYTPNINLTVAENKENKKGSILKLYLRGEYVEKFNTENLIRFIKRAYHNFNINFIVNKYKFNTLECKLYEGVLHSEKYNIVYDLNEHKFLCEKRLEKSENNESKENENQIYIGVLELYILKEILTNIELLGNLPGVDFYRNNRLCNAKNPIRNIGEIAKNLDSGQMRGKRCHVVFKYNNVKLSDINDVDSSLGLNTTKEICEDENKFNESLRIILENESFECNSMYEKYIETKKTNLVEYLSKESKNILYMKDDILINYNIEEKFNIYNNFLTIKTWSFDLKTMEYKFYDNIKKVKEDKKNGVVVTLVRKNSKIICEYVIPIVNELNVLIKKKQNLICLNNAKKILKEKNKFTDEQCDKYLKQQINIEQLKRENLKHEDKKEYDKANQNNDKIIKIISNSEFKEYFNEYLDKAIEKINEIRKAKNLNEKINEIIHKLDEDWDKAYALFYNKEYEESKKYYNKIIDYIKTLETLENEDNNISEYKTNCITEISIIDNLLERNSRLDSAIEKINVLINKIKQIDIKNIEGIKKGYEEIITYINSKDNIDIKEDLKIYSINAENKIENLVKKKIKKPKINIKVDIKKYISLKHDEVKPEDWENIKRILQSIK